MTYGIDLYIQSKIPENVTTLVLWAGLLYGPGVAAVCSGRLHAMRVHPTSPGCGENVLRMCGH